MYLLGSTLVGVFVAVSIAFGMSISVNAQDSSNVEVVPKSELQFEPLNPARGDASPQAGTLWGDIRKDTASGVILKFADGFSSPPHIHNITYRAVVISGAIHNDDPSAENMWMGPGSFWTQPAGEVHITAAQKGEGATAFLEILEGSYLVEPSIEAFLNPKQPLNLTRGNMVWPYPSDMEWIRPDASGKGDQRAAAGLEVAFLWGDLEEGKDNGSFVKLSPGHSVHMRGNGQWMRVVVIQGTASYMIKGSGNAQVKLEPGGYFGSKNSFSHRVSCEDQQECVLYVRTVGHYSLS